MKKFLILLLFCFCQITHSSDNYLIGDIKQITSIQGGLLVRLENNKLPAGCPANSTSNTYGWMLIPETSKVIIAVTLMHWHNNKRRVGLYIQNYSGSGYCIVNQIQPL